MGIFIGFFTGIVAWEIRLFFHAKKDKKLKDIQAQKEKELQDKKRLLAEKFDISNTDNQLRFVQDVDLYPQKLVKGEEYKVFLLVEKLIHQINGGYRIMTQPV